MQSSSFPHPIYTETVLQPNFQDAQQWFLHPLMALHRAHAVMLWECGLLTDDDIRRILVGLDSLDVSALETVRYSGDCEDLFFHIEAQLAAGCGAAVAGKLHTARSRNDIDITLYRMVLRTEILHILDALLALMARLLQMAEAHAASLMPAYTHTQPAQPTTLGHYLMGVVECLHRDATRLCAAYVTVNRNPLGACAITTTGFPINRHRTAELLGFDGLQENSIGAIAATDYVAETMAAISVAMLNCGKFTQDLLLWSTQEFGFLRVGDAWAQISSIMPQKRNPVAFEHARIQCSRAFAQSQAVLTCAHNTPFGDIVDSEDDLWPAVFRATEDARRSLRLLEGALADVEVNTARMRQLAHARFITVTEVADTLVRDGGLTFRTAHEVVARAVKQCGADDSLDAIHRALGEAAQVVLGGPLPLAEAQVRAALDPQHFVNVRAIPGGPAPDPLRAAIANASASCAHHQRWRTEALRKLQSASDLLGASASAAGHPQPNLNGAQPTHA
ncbi:MAG: argininosuccinate lyase [Bryobacterales bacterium]|jgi:argininosuccinate lyase|nr:argininosuccinate lyase [Bryobacterales bacterium]